MHVKLRLGNLTGRNLYEDLDVDRRIILQEVLGRTIG
jgi:hypothetical protein